jgi:hypothetical protein
MRRSCICLTALAVVAPLSATAIPVTGDFTGTVWGVFSNNATVPGGIAAGTAVTGSFQFENTGQAAYATNPAIGEERFVSLSAGSFFRVAMNGLVWESLGIGLIVRNDAPLLGDDLLSLGYDSSLPFVDPALALSAVSFPGVPPGLPNSSMHIDLFDTTAPTNLLSAAGVPLTASAINLPAINVMTGSVFGNVDGGTSFYQINFLVNSVQVRDVVVAVPEPSALSLMTLGLLAVALRRKALSTTR